MPPDRIGQDSLPITEILPEIIACLARASNLVLQAPPGAGKTTGVPLALLDQPWLRGKRLIMLEPRRLAVRAAATRMAGLLGQAVGATIGYRMRLDSKTSAATRIEIVTDGVFTRLIQRDPELAGIGAVLFDEAHERRLDSELGLALALETQAVLRPCLRLVAMSATLDGAALARLMGTPDNPASLLTAQGRSHPVTIRHLDAPAPGRLIEAVAAAIGQALAHHSSGGILVFLPGAHEIRRAARLLSAATLPASITVLPLHGDLPQSAQSHALQPAPPGRRHIVLATSIAETSLTIADIHQTIDCGLARVARFDPRTGMTRLETVAVTRAGADQRAGRAGRTAPGIAWRLWPLAAHNALSAYPRAEIALTDIAPLALELALWGVRDITSLRLLEPPATGALAAAREGLTRLGALDQNGQITAHGRQMATLGLSPRLAHMVIRGAEQGFGALAAVLAALLSASDRMLLDADLTQTIARYRADPHAFRPAERMVRQLLRRLNKTPHDTMIDPSDIDPTETGRVLALAYPERIARRREGSAKQNSLPLGAVPYLLANGAGAWVAAGGGLEPAVWLAVADLDGQQPDARIWCAAPLTLEALESALHSHITEMPSLVWDARAGRVSATQRSMLGAVALRTLPLDDPSPAAITQILLETIRHKGLDCLNWTPEARNFRARLLFLARCDAGDIWPDLADAALHARLDHWLAPALAGCRSLADIQRIDLLPLLRAMLDPAQLSTLERRAPTHVTVPSGSRILIDYDIDHDHGASPVLAVRLQEVFGLSETPTINHGRTRLVLSLLSPAGRPLQTTSDLAGFWRGSYAAVRAAMRGRYPRHPWPLDPANAPPTARAKPRKSPEPA